MFTIDFDFFYTHPEIIYAYSSRIFKFLNQTGYP